MYLNIIIVPESNIEIYSILLKSFNKSTIISFKSRSYIPTIFCYRINNVGVGGSQGTQIYNLQTNLI